MSEAGGVEAAGDWFDADVDVPSDVAVLNFVLQYYEHFDNNYGQDYKAAIQFDAKGRCAFGHLRFSIGALICYYQPASQLPASGHTACI